MDTGGPYLNAALLCEKVLEERDGVLSIIRAIDRITITAVSTGAPIPEGVPLGVVAFAFAVVIRSGVFKGTASIKLTIHAPSGNSVGESSLDVFLEGDDRGVNLVSPMQFSVQEDGLYWIDVTCNNQLFTRVPLRVVFQRVSQGSLQWPPAP
jgi:hypothetical protein